VEAAPLAGHLLALEMHEHDGSWQAGIFTGR
jgi:hypothetical protein